MQGRRERTVLFFPWSLRRPKSAALGAPSQDPVLLL